MHLVPSVVLFEMQDGRLYVHWETGLSCTGHGPVVGEDHPSLPTYKSAKGWEGRGKMYLALDPDRGPYLSNSDVSPNVAKYFLFPALLDLAF